jgi:hypothetical protein
MNLSDGDILELNELCCALLDDTLTELQKQRLSHWLATSEAARQFYIRFAGQSASLCHYASEMQTEESDPGVAGAKPRFRRWWMFSSLTAIAAALVLAIMLVRAPKKSHVAVAAVEPPVASENEFVARLTGSRECQWINAASTIAPGGRLRKGQHVALNSGFAEITFDSGAQVLLQGPASLDVNSAWSATLNHGRIKASFPPEAMGFSITNPTVEVVDLGTEFTMFADAGGASTDVLVLKGEVEAAPRLPADQQPIVLREKESRRFASTGVSTVHGNDAKFEQLTGPVALDRYVPPIGYARWSFDEADGDTFRAESFGLAPNAADVKLEKVSRSARGALHTSGRRSGALRFDGSLYARAAFPGMSENSPHTIAFWAKVPKDATLSSAYAMVAWASSAQKFGSHPFHIGWNRNPNEALVGVLRTDYGRGFAVGATPLRDGRWHHIAVVLIPRDDADNPVEVRQYVDGRLEGEGRPSPPGSDIFMSSDNNAPTANGTIWLGCRLGVRGVRADRFFGEMDELFIADRDLEQQEVVRLMTDNRLDRDAQP